MATSAGTSHVEKTDGVVSISFNDSWIGKALLDSFSNNFPSRVLPEELNVRKLILIFPSFIFYYILLFLVNINVIFRFLNFLIEHIT